MSIEEVFVGTGYNAALQQEPRIRHTANVDGQQRLSTGRRIRVQVINPDIIRLNARRIPRDDQLVILGVGLNAGQVGVHQDRPAPRLVVPVNRQRIARKSIGDVDHPGIVIDVAAQRVVGRRRRARLPGIHPGNTVQVERRERRDVIRPSRFKEPPGAVVHIHHQRRRRGFPNRARHIASRQIEPGVAGCFDIHQVARIRREQVGIPPREQQRSVGLIAPDAQQTFCAGRVRKRPVGIIEAAGDRRGRGLRPGRQKVRANTERRPLRPHFERGRLARIENRVPIDQHNGFAGRVRLVDIHSRPICEHERSRAPAITLERRKATIRSADMQRIAAAMKCDVRIAQIDLRHGPRSGVLA